MVQTTCEALVVSEVFPPAVGGSGLLLREVYRRFGARRVKVLADEGAGLGHEPPLGSIEAIDRIRLATRSWGLMDARGDLHHVRVARRIRAGSEPARTVVHCARALPEGVAAWMNRLAGGARYVCWSHGEDVTAACLSRELTWVMTRVFRTAEGVIANSKNTRNLLLGLGLDERTVHLAYPGVDVTRFHPGVPGAERRRQLLGSGDVLILSVGRLQRRKGHDVTLEAVARLRDQLPGLRYTIVGDGESRTRLEDLARRLRVDDCVTFCGEVPEDELASYFAAADIFVMPNRQDGEDIEGFGMVFLEAAACAKPSIGGNSGGVPEAVADGRTGLLVGGTDAEELARAIARLALDPVERRALGQAGLQRVQDGFTWDHAAARVAAIHDAILARH